MSDSIPSSILIVGSGVFGLGTAYALAQREEYKNTTITVLDRSGFPAPDASSVDSSRIIRADYADYHYSALCMESLKEWRGEWGQEGRYHEPGLAILLDGKNLDRGGKEEMQKEMRENLAKQGLKIGRKEDGGQVTVLDDATAVQAIAPSIPNAAGQSGYVNWTSGWADAEAGMRYLHKKVVATGRVELRKAEVKSLIFDHANGSVPGVELESGEKIMADLTVLATGAWSPKFIDMRGIASASGQVITYIDITQEEEDKLKTNPTLLNYSNGMFIIPPSRKTLKIGRHGYGYANFQTIPHPEHPESGEKIKVSLPKTKFDDPKMEIPKEGQDACRSFLRECIPEFANRPWTQTRICWYTDTPTGDWVIDYHPKYKNLFVATGGSGHGYKFVPKIGERIVDVMKRQPRDDLGAALLQKWRWPKEKYHFDHIWTNDWRGGRKGMILDEEHSRDQKTMSKL
jgi:sarcosine oxidase/L-pipecolate oxidase